MRRGRRGCRLPNCWVLRGWRRWPGTACCGRLLVRDPVTDIGLERLLTNVRHVMLTEATEATAADGKSGGAGDENLLDFYCAVARQCFINDYVFATTEAEAEAARACGQGSNSRSRRAHHVRRSCRWPSAPIFRCTRWRTRRSCWNGRGRIASRNYSSSRSRNRRRNAGSPRRLQRSGRRQRRRRRG